MSDLSPRAGWVLGVGVWTAGLVRVLSEHFHIPGLFSSAPLVALVVAAAMGLGLAIWRAAAGVQDRLAPTWPALMLPLLYVALTRPDPLFGWALLVTSATLVVFLAVEPSAARRAAPIALGAVVFATYLRTLGRTVGEADTFEFQVVAPKMGIAHPTGYPLYILLGKAFSLLPLGSVAWRVNLTSAVAATGAVVCLWRLIPSDGETHPRSPLVAMLAAAALAFSRTFWSQAVVAEVYALHLLFIGALLLLASALLQRPGARPIVWAMSFLTGLALSHHLTAVLLLPAVGLAVLLARPRMDWRGWAAAAGLLLVGLSVVAYIPVRWPALHEGQPMTLRAFADYVTGRQFGGALQLRLLRDPTRWAILLQVLREPFGWPGLALAGVGLAWMALRRSALAAVTGLAFLAYCLYGLIYLVPDVRVFLLPTHLLLALWIGAGVGALVRLTAGWRAWVPSTVLALLALLPASGWATNLPQVDQSGRTEAEAWGRYVLSLPLAHGAAVLADGEKFAPLYYLQQVEGLRPDLDLVVHFAEEEYRSDLAARLGAGQTVYLARYLPHLEGLSLDSVGPLVEVRTEPRWEIPPGSQEVHRAIGPGLTLAAYRLESDPLRRPMLHLTLYWSVEAPIQADLEVRLRLVGQNGAVLWESEPRRPVGGYYPTNAWPMGAVVADYHPIPFEAWMPPGTYRLEMGVAPRFASRGEETWTPLDTVEVRSTKVGDPLPGRIVAVLGERWLVGYGLPGEVEAGAPVVIDLAWAGASSDAEGWLAWVDAAGTALRTPFRVPGGLTRSRLTPRAPDQPGTYRVRIELEGSPVRCRWLAPPSAGCWLDEVRVLPVGQGLANFDGRLLLVAATVDVDRVGRGQEVPVVLRWRALRRMEKDYTVSVQLLGPDGRLHGQVDAWPVHGTRPTSAWGAGEELVDPYQVAVDPDAPPGRYQVVVAVYLLETMDRLPVVDTMGQPVADHVVVGELQVAEP